MNKYNVNFCRSVLAIAASSTLMLSGCNDLDQDVGKVSTNSQQFSGLGIDGYLARATVFIDSNNNGTRDAWEAFAFTDNDGYYSFNPKTEMDYCASSASAQQAQYCLKSAVEYGDVVLRIDGGYDIITGEPFIGQMSQRVNASAAVAESIISPISSLFTNVSTSDRANLLTVLNLTEDDLAVDYLNTDGSGAVNPQLLNSALKIHKVVAVLSDRLTDTYDEIGEDFGTPNDATSLVYPQLAQQIIAAGSSLDVALTDETLLLATLDGAEAGLRDIYNRKEFDLPADIGSSDSPSGFTRIIEVAAQYSGVVDALIDVSNSDFSLADAIGTSRTLETLVIKTVNEDNVIDASINNMIAFVDNDDNQAALDALVENLSAISSDVNGLVNHDFVENENVAEVVTIGSDVQAITAVAGMQLLVSDLNLGHGPDNLDDKEYEFYFKGDSGDLDGEFTLCVKHIDDANIDGTLGEGSTRGELAQGFWSILGASEESIESYNLLLTISFLGTTYQAILKPAGMATIDAIEYQKIKFDYDGDLNTSHSEDGFITMGNIPSTNQECADSLPSRIGL